MNFRNRSHGGYNNFNRPPVEVGKEYEVTIEAVGEKGDGISKIKGFVIFVPNVNTGDRVRIKVNKVLRKVAFADVIAELGDSDDMSQSNAEDSESFGESSFDDNTAEEATEDNREDFGTGSVEDSEDFGEELLEEDSSDKEPSETEEKTE